MLDILIDVICDVVPALLAGIAAAALVGMVVVGLQECFKIAQAYFSRDPNAEAVSVLKKDCQQLQEVLSSCPRIRDAMRGGKTGMVLTYQNGQIETFEAIDKKFNSDFNDCGGYVVYRNDQRHAYKVY